MATRSQPINLRISPNLAFYFTLDDECFEFTQDCVIFEIFRARGNRRKFVDGYVVLLLRIERIKNLIRYF